MRWLAFAGVIVVALWFGTRHDQAGAPASAAAQDDLRTGAHVVVKKAWAACPKLEDLQRVAHLAGEGDRAAGAAYAVRQGCTDFAVGTTGVVEDYSLEPKAACIREKGSPDCYWFPMSLLDREEHAPSP